MVSGEGRADAKTDGSGVDPDAFAEQINYLAALGRLVVPRAFAFVGRRVLFVGDEPFDAEELGNLLHSGSDSNVRRPTSGCYGVGRRGRVRERPGGTMAREAKEHDQGELFFKEK